MISSTKVSMHSFRYRQWQLHAHGSLLQEVPRQLQIQNVPHVQGDESDDCQKLGTDLRQFV